MEYPVSRPLLMRDAAMTPDIPRPLNTNMLIIFHHIDCSTLVHLGISGYELFQANVPPNPYF